MIWISRALYRKCTIIDEFWMQKYNDNILDEPYWTEETKNSVGNKTWQSEEEC